MITMMTMIIIIIIIHWGYLGGVLPWPHLKSSAK